MDSSIKNIFKVSRQKIILLIMSMLTLVLVGTIGTIFITTYRAVYQSNQRQLEIFTEDYINGYGPKGNLEAKPGTESSASPQDKTQTELSLANADSTAVSPQSVTQTELSSASQGQLPPANATRFAGGLSHSAVVMYLVRFSSQGAVLDMLNDLQPIMSDAELQKTAWGFVIDDRTSGTGQGLLYRITKTSDSTYVVMTDNTLMQDSMTAMLRNTLIFGAAALLFLFGISFYLAGRIVQPLEESYTKQKQFISDAGHELKTPISTINANAELLHREIGENPWLDNIQFENQRMKELVTQLLDLARTENVDPVREDVDFSRIVMGGILPFESVAFDKGFLLDTDVVDNLHVLGDQRQLGQLISTLTDNALAHAEKMYAANGSIRISLTRVKNNAVLQVSNPGPEIPMEEREKIFERFYRSDASRELNGHYGLGLAIAKAIVTAHHGRISVDCKGGWTTFTAVIPCLR